MFAVSVCCVATVAFITACGAAGAADAGLQNGVAAESAPVAPDLAGSWKALATDLHPIATKSRALLLGKRDPNGTSCVGPEPGGTVVADPDGGVGTQLGAFHYASIPSRNSPMADFSWHQTSLKPTLEGLLARNQAIFPEAVRLAEKSEQMARALDGLADWPQELEVLGVASQDHWLGYCASRLDSAIGRCDLPACKIWAGELAAATFALADLHRWLDLLLRNQLSAIAFQAQCKTLFETCEKPYAGNYDVGMHPSGFPAGQLTMNGLHNFREVEHQAEWLFRVPGDFLSFTADSMPQVKRDALPDAPAAVWVPPNLRSAFARLRNALSPANQQVWDRAAHSPFLRSYLANMLYRAQRVGTVDALAIVLQRFCRIVPQADPSALMDAIFYRGDVGASTLWDDRYQPYLLAAASALGGTDEQVLLGAQHFTRAVFGGWDNYGAAPTLRDALTQKRFDCLRATDMIGTLYRNAGRGGYYSVRWCAGVAGHTVAAAEVRRSGGPAIVMVDGLEKPQTATDLWPYAYTRGHAWPTGYPSIQADVYAAELYARGLDDYVWAEGYIIRGPNAGLLTRTFLPYLPNRATPETRHVRIDPQPRGLLLGGS